MAEFDRRTLTHPKDRFFETAHLSAELGTRAIRGGAAVFLGQGAQFLLQTGSTVILARLLTPADFGLIAMVTAVTGFIARFKDMGLTMATVHRERVTHAQASSLFWLNVAVSTMLTGSGVALGPVLAGFYDEPSLTAITAALSLTFFFDGVTGQHLAIVRRQMRFALLSTVEIVAYAVGVFAALLLAWAGAGYWALVVLPVVQTCVRGGSLLGATRWIPGIPRRRTGIRSMVNYGANLSGFSLLTYLGRSADNILIGRVWGANETGLYTKAYSLLTLPLEQINGPLNSVAIPVLSRLQSEPDRYTAYYYQALSLVAYLTGPLIVLMGVTAHDLLAVVLGPQWERSARIFQILAFAAIFQPILYTAGWIWLSLDRTKEMFRWSAITAPSFIAAFAVGLPWGPEGVALSYAICVNALTPVGLGWAYRGTQITLRGAIAAVRRPYALSLLMLVVAMIGTASLPGVHTFTRLGTVVGLSVSIGLGMAVGLPGMRRDLRNLGHLAKRLKP